MTQNGKILGEKLALARSDIGLLSFETVWRAGQDRASQHVLEEAGLATAWMSGLSWALRTGSGKAQREIKPPRALRTSQELVKFVSQKPLNI